MAAELVTIGRREYSFVPDDNDLATRRNRAIVSGRLVDELTGQPPHGVATISVAEPGYEPRVADGGMFGVVGRPWLMCTPLVTAGLRLTLSIRVAGFLPIELLVEVAFVRRTLAAAAVHDDYTLTLDPAPQPLAVGQHLLVGQTASAAPPAGSADIQELAEIAAVSAGGNDVTLRGPLRFDHPLHALVAPDVFAPALLGDVELHREPLAICGRTLQRVAGRLAALPFAEVVVTEVWRQPPPATASVPADHATLVALNPPVGAEWPATTTLATVCDLPVDPAVTQKPLRAPAQRGSRTLALSDLEGLAIHDVLIVDADDDARVEFVRVQSLLAGPVSPGPGQAILERPLVRRHDAEARVSRADAQPPGAQATLVRDARAGDPCVFVTRPCAIVGTHEVRLSGGGAVPVACHRLRPLAAKSNDGGWYRLPPVSRVAQMTIVASAPPLADKSVTFLPGYPETETRLDIVFE
jgi:hypothetical protein